MRLTGALASAIASATAAIEAPSFVVATLLLVSSTCAVAGVNMLAGPAWALIAASGIGFVLAGLLLRGMSRE